MKKLLILIVVIIVFCPLLAGCTREEQKTITVFAGAASKPALEEIARLFEAETGTMVYFNFSGSGTALSQMKLARSGDLYIPGSPDYMVMAEREGIIEPESIRIIAYLIPAILVQDGNPQNIHLLSDLARPGIRVAIGNPRAVCVGLYAIEILDYNGLLADVEKNIVVQAESCERAATFVALKSVDAVLGWHVFAHWHPETTNVVYLRPEQLPRLAYIAGAISTFTKDRASSQKFLDFLVSAEGQRVFRKWGYIVSESEARKFAPDAEIGGEYELPENYPLSR